MPLEYEDIVDADFVELENGMVVPSRELIVPDFSEHAEDFAIRLVPKAVRVEGLVLAPQQEEAVTKFAAWFKQVGNVYHEVAPIYLQQGFAGTGKTTVLPFFIEAAGLDPEADVTFVAPTGKAAKVMTKKLRAQGINKPAITIHAAMYRPKGLKYLAIEAQIAATQEMLSRQPANTGELMRVLKVLQRDLDRAYDVSAPSFQLNPDSGAMKSPKLIVCDEASMVGERMVDDMVIFGTPILAIGDSGQLKPVGDKEGFFIRKPDHALTDIHRQALDNPIIWYSREIREGRHVGYGSHGDGMLRIVPKKLDDVTYDMTRDVQIICGTNAYRHRLTRKLRKLAGFDLRGPVEGEMMICVKNSQKHPGLVNGTQLMVTFDSDELKAGHITTRVRAKCEDGFDYDLNCIQAILEENYLGVTNCTASKRSVKHAKEDKANHHLDWAYAITCHKSQGSQWPEVCVHDESGSFREQQTEWLYTAVTRAAEKLTVVC